MRLSARAGRHRSVGVSQARRELIPRSTRGGEARKLRDIVHLASLGGGHDGGLRLLLGAGAISLTSSGSRRAFRRGRNPNGSRRQHGGRRKDIHCNLGELTTRTNPALATTVRVRSGFLYVVTDKMQIGSSDGQNGCNHFLNHGSNCPGPKTTCQAPAQR